jgi:hypothetical protein
MALIGFLHKKKKIMLVMLFFLIIISVMQYRVPEIIGYDGWSHIKIAELIRNTGFIKEIPITESILSENYADLHLLFHIFLIPFTLFGLINGAKIASIFFASLFFTFFYWYLKKNKINFAFFWTSLLALSSVDLMYRFLLPRVMPLALLCLIFTLFFLERRMYKSLLFISLLFTWLYSAFVIQIFIILVYFIIDAFVKKKPNYRILVYSLAGMALPLILNPYFP